MSRPKCPHCLRPPAYCYCHLLSPTMAGIDLIILQHPSEVRHALNTARIAELGISNCQLFVGEDFTQHTALLSILEKKNACVLFPSPNAMSPAIAKQQLKPELCIIIDGTWRKARKILYTNPFLQQLQFVSLVSTEPSMYRVRKAPSKHALSTVEATVYFLRQMEASTDAHQPLLDAFDYLINSQINAMGNDIYQSNYTQPT